MQGILEPLQERNHDEDEGNKHNDHNESLMNSSLGTLSMDGRALDNFRETGSPFRVNPSCNAGYTMLFEVVALIERLEDVTASIVGSRGTTLNKSALPRITPVMCQELHESRLRLEIARGSRNSADNPTHPSPPPVELSPQDARIKLMGAKFTPCSVPAGPETRCRYALRAIIPTEDEVVISGVQAVCKLSTSSQP